VVRVLADLEALSRAAAEEFARTAADAVRRRGFFRVALAGGTTPRRLYALLADRAAPWRARIPWSATHVFFGDERLVPPDHPDSNYRMARRALFARVPIPPRQIHRVRGETRRPAAAARELERALRACFRLRSGAVPRFDLVILGMGADGHVASLFPGDPALGERRRLAAVADSGRGAAAPERARVTLTLPVLNRAARLMVLVSGASKAGALRRALAPGRASPDPPARLLRPGRGRVTWLVDRAAARLLRSSP
jgi:6-phosphogluconolactonase